MQHAYLYPLTRSITNGTHARTHARTHAVRPPVRPSVRQSVSESVSQSVRPSVSESVSLSQKPQIRLSRELFQREFPASSAPDQKIVRMWVKATVMAGSTLMFIRVRVWISCRDSDDDMFAEREDFVVDHVTALGRVPAAVRRRLCHRHDVSRAHE